MSDELNLKIKNLRGVYKFDFNLPISKGVKVICGINGVGKSTIMTALSKTVYPDALNKYFRNDGGTDTEVYYSYKGVVNTWRRNQNSTWSMDENNKKISFKGIFESSFIYGNRFSDAHKSKVGKIIKIKESDYIDADDFVKEWLGYILKGNRDIFNGLKKTSNHVNLKAYDLSRPIYTRFGGKEPVNQFRMSSGEYLILGLLDYLKERFDSLNEIKGPLRNEMSIVILDEADMALHPSSQERLMEFLDKACKEFNLCVYISTHSPVIISKMSKKDIFLLEEDGGVIHVIPDCYPGYAMRDVSQGHFFDKLILVEDVLEKAFVEKVIRDDLYKVNALFHVVAIGGYKGVIDFHREALRLSLGGDSCEIMTILDGDIEIEAKAYLDKKPQMINVAFLPIKSLEKFIFDTLIDNKDRNVFSRIENSFFRGKGLKVIIDSYKEQNLNGDQKELRKGKKLWDYLLVEAINQGSNESRFTDYLCDIAVDVVGNEQLKKRLIKFLDA